MDQNLDIDPWYLVRFVGRACEGVAKFLWLRWYCCMFFFLWHVLRRRCHKSAWKRNLPVLTIVLALGVRWFIIFGCFFPKLLSMRRVLERLSIQPRFRGQHVDNERTKEHDKSCSAWWHWIYLCVVTESTIITRCSGSVLLLTKGLGCYLESVVVFVGYLFDDHQSSLLSTQHPPYQEAQISLVRHCYNYDYSTNFTS